MDKIIFFTILVLFPFGQIIKIGMFNAFDISVFILAIITVLKKPKYPNWFKYLLPFTMLGLLSWIANYFIFGGINSLTGLLYLIRFVSYSFVGVYVFNRYDNNKKINLLNDKLLLVSIASAIFGWIQYFLYPDLTALKYLGWDDHLLRIIGTFIDPTFLGLVLTLGSVIAIEKKKNIFLYFLSITVAFTYSRISFLILFLVLLYKKKYLGLIVFIISLLFLPKMIGEGTNLYRTASGINKLTNYSQTFEIIKKSPVIGIGYNNICLAREYYLKDIDTTSHACSGSDSSILFILATTGFVGLILFANFIAKVPRDEILVLSFIAVFIHSIFANSLFYPHIMFWMFCLIGSRSEVKS